ncbi:MAG: hypothetical protein AAF211_10255, partial [Myxococcota bacterium]
PQTSLSVTYHYRCHECDETFEVEDVSARVAPLLITVFFVSFWVPFAVWAVLGTLTWVAALCTVLPGLFGALLTLGMALQVRDDVVEHPVDRNEPPVEDPQLL